IASLYIHDGTQALTLQISGAVTQGSAAELEQTWLTARSTLAGRELLIDLGNVTSVNDDGQTVLRRLASQGARTLARAAPQRVEPDRLLFEDVLRHREGFAEARSSVRTNCEETLVVLC